MFRSFLLLLKEEGKKVMEGYTVHVHVRLISKRKEKNMKWEESLVIELKFIMQSNLISITKNSTCMLSNIKMQRTALT